MRAPYTRATPLDELSEAFERPEERWAQQPWVDPSSVLPEVLDWTADPRSFHPQHQQAWNSLTTEALTAITGFGTKLTTNVHAEVLAAQTALRGFDAKVQSTRDGVEKTISELIHAVSRHPDAALRDLVVAASQSRVSAHRRDQLRDLLWATVRLGQRSPEEFASLAAGIMRDDALSVTFALRRLSDGAAVSATWPGPNEAAHLGPQARVDLVARILRAQPPPAVHHIVWLAASPAQLRGPVARLGDIDLFEGQWIKAKLAAGDMSGLPTELSADQPIGVSNIEFGTENEFVLARVDLGTQTIADPIGVARFELRALLAAASFRRGRRRWKVVPRHLHVQDGRIVSWGYFDFGTPREHSMNDSTATYLAELIRDLQGRRVSVDDDLGRLLQEIDRLQAGLDHNDPATVLNLVRLIEHVNSRITHGAMSWSDFTRQQFEIAWIREQMYDALHRVGELLTFLGGSHFTASPAEIVSRYGPFNEFHPDGTWTVYRDRLLKALPDLASIAQVHTSSGRRLLETGHRLRDSPAALRWAGELRRSFNLSLGRLQRVRDSIAHGGPAPRTLEDAFRFCRTLTFGALGWTLDAMIRSQSIERRFQDEMDASIDWLDSLTTGPLEKTLFRP